MEECGPRRCDGLRGCAESSGRESPLPHQLRQAQPALERQGREAERKPGRRLSEGFLPSRLGIPVWGGARGQEGSDHPESMKEQVGVEA